jgi:hypothetical protein
MNKETQDKARVIADNTDEDTIRLLIEQKYNEKVITAEQVARVERELEVLNEVLRLKKGLA